MKELSRLIASIPASMSAVMMQKGREMKAAGIDVVNLAGGEPDFNTPRHIIEAAYQAMLAGDTHYPTSWGSPPLLDAICAKLLRENSVSMDPDQILVTPGGKWAIAAALATLLNPGDEVLVLDPSWVSYGPMVELQNAVPIRVGLPSTENFLISADLLEAHISARTKLLMVNSPNNPTGRVLTRSEVDAITQVAIKHDLYVISDEIYEHILFEGAQHYSPAAEPGMAERTFIVNGFSKAYAMTGWRLGWLAGPKAAIKRARSYQTQSVTSAASFAMTAGVAALNGPLDCVQEMVDAYVVRRRFMLDAMEEIPGIECSPVEGAFYIFPRFTQTDKGSMEISTLLLEDALLSTTPGIAYGAAGEGHVRFSFANDMSELEKTVERLARVVPTL